MISLINGQCLTFRDIEAVAYEAARFGKTGKYKNDIVEIRNRSTGAKAIMLADGRTG